MFTLFTKILNWFLNFFQFSAIFYVLLKIGHLLEHQQGNLSLVKTAPMEAGFFLVEVFSISQRFHASINY